MKAALFALLVALQVADVALTVAILKRGGAETWPTTALWLDFFKRQSRGLISLKVISLGVVVYYYADCPLWLMAAACAVMSYVCFRNWREFKK